MWIKILIGILILALLSWIGLIIYMTYSVFKDYKTPLKNVMKHIKKSLEKCERIKIMIIHKINRRLTNLESMCTFCSRYVNLEKDEFVATYSRGQYKTCHRTCYNNYLKYVKEVNNKCMK